MRLSQRGWCSAAAAVSALALVASACSPDLPPSVVEGSKVSATWDGPLTSTNTATTSGATSGNLDVAAVTRSRFGELVDDKVVADQSFGSVQVVDQDPFTVRYDLAEPTWSDGTPLDAADLLLAWAAESDFFTAPAGGAGGAWFNSVPTGLKRSSELPTIHESGRWVEVVFSEPVVDYATALDVAVPAHVVGRRAFDLEDPMEAKQAVITAIREVDVDALEDISDVWNGDFVVPERTGDVDGDLLLSSGPYRVAEIGHSDAGEQRVELVVNREYAGDRAPEFERIDLVQMQEARRLAALGTEVDVTTLTPTARNWAPIRELERRDFGVATAHDGTMWVLVVRVDRGVFVREAARAAFLRGVPRAELKRAGGRWADAYASTDALVFPPDNESYAIASEDSGFKTTLSGSAHDAAEERNAIGVPPGTPVCVLYDKSSAFASRAFAGMRAGMAGTGWAVRDCGEKGLRDVSGRGDWHAVLFRLPVPRSPADIAAQWGSTGAFNLSGSRNTRRDALIQQLARTADFYDARDVRVAIEKSIVGDALALPIAMNPLVAVGDRDVVGARPRPGAVAPLMSRAHEWGLPED